VTEIDRENLLILCYEITENFVARRAFAIIDNIIAVIVIGALGVPPLWDLIHSRPKQNCIPQTSNSPKYSLGWSSTVSLALLTGVPSCSPKEAIKESPPTHC